ncbi:MAG: hypothetical protein GQ570_13520 [Helicobacteraceae bacterium]|nr:hypothetical protein [Helicobacteraceae bacterium]
MNEEQFNISGSAMKLSYMMSAVGFKDEDTTEQERESLTVNLNMMSKFLYDEALKNDQERSESTVTLMKVILNISKLIKSEDMSAKVMSWMIANELGNDITSQNIFDLEMKELKKSLVQMGQTMGINFSEAYKELDMLEPQFAKA